MAKSYPQPPQESSDDFAPKSFILMALDETGSVAMEISWGETIADVKKFATLLLKTTSGQLNSIILEHLKEQSININNGNKKYAELCKIVNKKDKSDLVIDPLNVEVNL